MDLLVGELEGACTACSCSTPSTTPLWPASATISRMSSSRAREHPRRAKTRCRTGASTARRGFLQEPHERPGDQARSRDRVREHHGERLCPLERDRLGDELAQRDAQVREDQERDCEGERRCEPRVEVIGRGAARPIAPRAIEKTVIASWTVPMKTHRCGHQGQRAFARADYPQLRSSCRRDGSLSRARTRPRRRTRSPARATRSAITGRRRSCPALRGASTRRVVVVQQRSEYRDRFGLRLVRTYVLSWLRWVEYREEPCRSAAQPRQGHAVRLVAEPVHGLRAPLHVLLRPRIRAARRPAVRTTATGRRSGSRSTSPKSCAGSSPGRAGSEKRSRSARRPIPISPPKGATG